MIEMIEIRMAYWLDLHPFFYGLNTLHTWSDHSELSLHASDKAKLSLRFCTWYGIGWAASFCSTILRAVKTILTFGSFKTAPGSQYSDSVIYAVSPGRECCIFFC